MDTAPDLLATLEIAVFSRRWDGGFSPWGRNPPWIAGLAADPAFPFLRTFLETAATFWAGSSYGCIRSGPCAETDATGKEFHFEVVAVSLGPDKYLVFERRPDVEIMQDVLQKARESALANEQLTTRLERLKTNQTATMAGLASAASDISALAAALGETPLSAEQRAMVERMKSGGVLIAGQITRSLRALG